MSITRDFLTQRIDATKAQIATYEDAVLALGEGGVQEYSLDTGQTRQRVTKFDIKDIQTVLDGLYNRLAILCARRDGSGVVIGRPAF